MRKSVDVKLTLQTSINLNYHPQYKRAISTTVFLFLFNVILGFGAPVYAHNHFAENTTSHAGNYLAGRQAQFDAKAHFAVKYYLAVLKVSPNNLFILRRTIKLLISEGRIEEALVKARHIQNVSKQITNTTILILALEKIKNKEFAKASKLIDQLPNNGINSYLTPMLKAWLLASEKKYEAALQLIDEKIENPGMGMLYAIHGALISEFSGNIDEAIDRFSKILDNQKGRSIRTVHLLGQLYERIDQKDQAKKVYDNYKKLKPETTILDGAYSRLKSKVNLNTKEMDILVGFSEALFSIGFAIQNQNSIQTINFSRLAIYLRPDFSMAKLLLAETLEENNSFRKANGIYNTLTDDPDYTWSARLRTAYNLDRLGETAKAIRKLQRMSIANLQRSDALIKLGNLLQRHKRYQASINAYEQAKQRIKKITKQHWSLYFSLGISYERTKRWPLAEKHLLKALELRPNHPSVLNYLGYSWVEQGIQLERAKKMLKEAVKQRPRDGYIIDSFGWVLYRLGDIEGAIKQLERAVLMRPEDPTINDHLGDIYWTAGRKIEARFQWNKALVLEPEKDQILKIKLKIKSGLPQKNYKQTGI